MRWLSCVWVALFLTACSSAHEGTTLEVRCVSDFVAGTEAANVRTRLYSGDVTEQGARLIDSVERVLLLQDDLSAGARVATFESLPLGVYAIEVVLTKRDGSQLGKNVRIVEVTKSETVTLHVTRQCGDVVCVDGTASTCLAGECVDPRCSAEDRTHCPPTLFCTADAQCQAASSCAQASCDDGVCVLHEREDACGATEWCRPESGCAPIDEPVMPKGDDSRCGTICPLAADSCWYGYYVCATREDGTQSVTCTAFLQRPVGSPCGAARECNAERECVDAMSPDAGVDAAVLDASVDASRDASADASRDALVTVPDMNDTHLDAAPDLDVEFSDASVPGADAFADATVDAPPAREFDVVVERVVGAPSSISEGAMSYTSLITVRLSAMPSGNVRVRVRSNNGRAVLMTCASVCEDTFDASNWSTPRTYAFVAYDNTIVDGDAQFDAVADVLLSGTDDSRFYGATGSQSFTVVDNDVAQISFQESASVVTEHGKRRGTTRTVHLRMPARPGTDFSVRLTFDPPSQAQAASTWDGDILTGSLPLDGGYYHVDIPVEAIDDALDDNDAEVEVTAQISAPGTPFHNMSARMTLVVVDDEGVERISRNPLVASSGGGVLWAMGDNEMDMSSNGDLVVFSSQSADIDPTLPAMAVGPFVYLHDRRTGDTRAIRRPYSNDPVTGTMPTIADDGSYVYFVTEMNSLVWNDTDTQPDLVRYRVGSNDDFVRPMYNTTTMIDGTINAYALAQTDSLLITTTASNLTTYSDTNAASDVYYCAASPGNCQLLSMDMSGYAQGGNFASISGDATTRVFYSSNASAIVGTSAYGVVNTFWSTTALLPPTLAPLRVSNEGDYVAGYEVVGADVFYRAYSLSGTLLGNISVNAMDMPISCNGGNIYAWSVDNQRVLWVPGCGSVLSLYGASSPQVLMRDFSGGTVVISATPGGDAGDGQSAHPVFADSDTRIGFVSYSTDLTDDDGYQLDVFVRKME